MYDKYKHFALFTRPSPLITTKLQHKPRHSCSVTLTAAVEKGQRQCTSCSLCPLNHQACWRLGCHVGRNAHTHTRTHTHTHTRTHTRTHMHTHTHTHTHTQKFGQLSSLGHCIDFHSLSTTLHYNLNHNQFIHNTNVDLTCIHTLSLFLTRSSEMRFCLIRTWLWFP